jgi:SAM-dependent methyltransferase
VAATTALVQPTHRATVACHVCSSMDNVTHLEARGFRIAECRNCGLWFVNPQPTVEELKQFYATYDSGDLWREMEERFNRSIRKVILRRKRSGTILDVGCGSGNFLRCMKEKGFSTFGIEPSVTGSGYARDAHQVDIYHGMIEDYLTLNSGRQFDVITLLNVLEHLTSPVQTLLQLSQVLAPDGVLAVVVPDARFHDIAGRVRKLFGARDPYWIEYDPFLSGFRVPDHLCSFQPRTIASLLRRCGFRVVNIENAPVIFNASFLRDAAKWFVFGISQALYYLTFRQVLVGYSTLVLAQKISTERPPGTRER